MATQAMGICKGGILLGTTPPPPRGMSSSSPNTIKVVVNGACKPLGKIAIAAVSKARGMEVAGAIDTVSVGEDAGAIARLDEPLEIPICSDLVMVLGSLSQTTTNGVMLDFTESSLVVENVRQDCSAGACERNWSAYSLIHTKIRNRLSTAQLERLVFCRANLRLFRNFSSLAGPKQATAFGLRSVVSVPGLEVDKVAALSTFCRKSSMGCLIAPTLSIGSILLQQAALAAAFHYKQIEIVESRQDSPVYPSYEALNLAESFSGLGQTYNQGDLPTDTPARGAIVGDGIRVHSLSLPGVLSSTSVYLSSPGEVFSLKHDVTNEQALIPGLLMAIRRVIRLKSLVYGLEKIM